MSYMIKRGAWPEGGDRPKLGPLLLFARYAKIEIYAGMADLARFLSYRHEAPIGLLRIEDVDLSPVGGSGYTPEWISGYARDWRKAEVKQATLVAKALLVEAGLTVNRSEMELGRMVAEVVDSLLRTPDFTALLDGSDIGDAVNENPRSLRNARSVVVSFGGRRPGRSVQDPPDERREVGVEQATLVANSVLVEAGLTVIRSEMELGRMVAEVVDSLLRTPDFIALLNEPDFFVV